VERASEKELTLMTKKKDRQTTVSPAKELNLQCADHPLLISI
jgi:hypothetical protein